MKTVAGTIGPQGAVLHAVDLGVPEPGECWAVTSVSDDRADERRGKPLAEDELRYLNMRTVGVFAKREKALEIAEKNFGDLNEAGWWPWLVIEQIGFGLYPIPTESIWFEYNRQAECWKKMDGPPSFYPGDGERLVSFCEIG